MFYFYAFTDYTIIRLALQSCLWPVHRFQISSLWAESEAILKHNIKREFFWSVMGWIRLKMTVFRLFLLV